ncbi:MAG: hypothetical protein FJW40_09145 [Acidobacteria bacterium]|nr:hypothetical protein [Acidobacteriota bacterium]
MPISRRTFLKIPVAFPAFSQQSSSPAKAGFAETDITPEIGMEQPGGYGKVFHQWFHDPCKARAAVFGDGRGRVALVGLDALIVPRHLVLAARREIEKRCGLPGANVLIGASHSHSSGPVGMVQPGQYDHASELVRRLAYEKSSAADPRYLALVRERIVEAVCRADAAREELALSAGRGHEDKAAFNRRFRMKNGLTFTHPGQGNPDIVKSAGPIDPEVGVIGAFDASGRLAGCVVTYACHATTSPGGISANWIHYLERTIRGVFGEQAVVVFLQGASGDITQVDNLSPHRQPGGDEYARLVGGRVGAEAVKTLLSAPRGVLTPVRSVAKTWTVGHRIPSPERVREALALVQKDPKTVDPADWAFAKETVMLDAQIQAEPRVEVEVQVVQVGPAAFVSNPAEYFVELGLDIKRRSPFPFTWPVELANGCTGYVPTEEALSATGGGYETRLTSYSNLEVSAGRQMADAGVELLKTLKPGEIPNSGPAPAFKGPWTYGNLPPQVR